MFDITAYTIQNKGVHITDTYFKIRNIHIVDISSDKGGLQILVYPTQSILSYDTGSEKEKLMLYSLLHSYLLQHEYPPLFVGVADVANVADSASDRERLQPLFNNRRSIGVLYYRSGTQIYKTKLKFERQHVYIRVGGQFESCVEIFIYLNDRIPYLAQIYSEPECGYTAFLEQGDSIHMVKSALQLCQMLFRVSKFKLKDKSNIECAKETKEERMKREPPRKLKKPLSLAHLSIVNSSATWYERHFQAYLENLKDNANYKQGLENLEGAISMSYDDFADEAMLTHVQYDELRPYYEGAKTWMEFFRAVPKGRQCDLFPWLPRFMNGLMKFDVNAVDWSISLDDVFGGVVKNSGDEHPVMTRTNLEFLFAEPAVAEAAVKRGGSRGQQEQSIVARMSNRDSLQTMM
jgi:hypothetical protein